MIVANLFKTNFFRRSSSSLSTGSYRPHNGADGVSPVRVKKHARQRNAVRRRKGGTPIVGLGGGGGAILGVGRWGGWGRVRGGRRARRPAPAPPLILFRYHL